MPERSGRLAGEPSKGEELARRFEGPGRLSARMNEAHKRLVGLLRDFVVGPRDLEAAKWLLSPASLDPSAAFLTPGFAVQPKPWVPRGTPIEMLRPWNRPSEFGPLGLLAASDWERVNRGIPGNQPKPATPLPNLPYGRFLPQPGIGPVFRVPKEKKSA